MNLNQTPVSRCLDKKLLIFGFEIPDLLVVFLTLSVLNFVFGTSSLKLFCVWFPTMAIAGVLRWSKRGKPDNYLIHWARYQVKSGTLSAYPDPTVPTPPIKTRRK